MIHPISSLKQKVQNYKNDDTKKHNTAGKLAAATVAIGTAGAGALKYHKNAKMAAAAFVNKFGTKKQAEKLYDFVGDQKGIKNFAKQINLKKSLKAAGIVGAALTAGAVAIGLISKAVQHKVDKNQHTEEISKEIQELTEEIKEEKEKIAASDIIEDVKDTSEDDFEVVIDGEGIHTEAVNKDDANIPEDEDIEEVIPTEPDDVEEESEE